MPDDRLDLRDTVMWGRRIAGLGGEVFEHRGRLDEHEHRMLRVEETRTEDMVLAAELREALKILQADVEGLTKALAVERTMREKLIGRLKERFSTEAKPAETKGELQE